MTPMLALFAFPSSAAVIAEGNNVCGDNTNLSAWTAISRRHSMISGQTRR